jgi:hypothetical protein
MKESNPPISDKLSESAARNRIKQWGICDWRNKEAYPNNHKTIKNEEWRWEFLRRDMNYREVWSTWDQGLGLTASADELIHYGLHEFLDPRLSYKQLPKKRKYIFQQYPAVLNQHGEISWTYSETDEVLANDIESALNDAPGDFVDIRLNLRRPIALQMDSQAARKILESKQKELIGRVLRHRVSDDPSEYLRTLDAAYVQASDQAIGSHIFGGTTKGSATTRGIQARKKARQMWQDF